MEEEQKKKLMVRFSLNGEDKQPEKPIKKRSSSSVMDTWKRYGCPERFLKRIDDRKVKCALCNKEILDKVQNVENHCKSNMHKTFMDEISLYRKHSGYMFRENASDRLKVRCKGCNEVYERRSFIDHECKKKEVSYVLMDIEKIEVSVTAAPVKPTDAMESRLNAMIAKGDFDDMIRELYREELKEKIKAFTK